MNTSTAMARRSCSDFGQRGDDVMRGGASAGVRLFGVQVQLHAATCSSPATSVQLHKSYSMDCLRLQASPSMASSSLFLSIDEGSERATGGYLSDGPHGVAAAMPERRKGVPWSEEEHRLFLLGLEKLGRGDWRGISRSFVTTRTPTQVASHAQKFFLRQSSIGKKTNTTSKRRSSLFDMVQNCERSSSDCKGKITTTSASLSLKVSHQVSFSHVSHPLSLTSFSHASSVASVSEPSVAVVTEQAQAQAHGYGHHCSRLDLELGMSLSTTPSIGT